MTLISHSGNFRSRIMFKECNAARHHDNVLLDLPGPILIAAAERRLNCESKSGHNLDVGDHYLEIADIEVGT